jgi:hypothetical protein
VVVVVVVRIVRLSVSVAVEEKEENLFDLYLGGD